MYNFISTDSDFNNVSFPGLTVTFNAGLFSSLLSAASKRCDGDDIMARNEARFLQGLLRETVSSINLGLRIAYQFENIAVRMVQETKILNKQTKKDFFRSILYSDEKDKRNKFGKNGVCKTHQWIPETVFL